MDNKTITISTAPRLAGMLLAFVFLLAGQMLFAQSKQVTGVVKDVTGETVIGASVVEKGTANGTITDFDNAWVIETKEMFYYIFWCTTA